MVFSDLFFLFVFLPAVVLCYIGASFIDKLFAKGPEQCNIAKNSVLVIFSLLFYAWGEPVYVFLMLTCVLINYIVGLLINKADGDDEATERKLALAIGVACNIGILCIYKYLNFFASILTDLGYPVANPKIALPIGISFYVFQSISYLIDVYRRESPVQKHFGNLLLYISMFPQLIAGPIVRYGTVAAEIHNRKVTAQDFSDGVYRFLIGLGKKVILANQLSEISDQFLVDGLSNLTTLGAWVGIVAFMLQIYFDFSGYSDMAIGMGRCMGFHFNENFNHPYCCKSISEFWRRWHMSLGSFFRDYVYIPLGGNRRHQMLNILVVWFLTGMWHGASWNFIIWGVYFGLIVTIEKYTLLKVINKIPAILLHVYSLLLVVIGWGIFYFDDTEKMLRFFDRFFGNAEFSDFVATNAIYSNLWLIVVALLLCMPVRNAIATLGQRLLGNNPKIHLAVCLSSRAILSVAILLLSVALLVGATNNAFIYTRF